MEQKQVLITGKPDVQEMLDLFINYANRERRDLKVQILDELLDEDLHQTDAGLIYFLDNKFEVNNPPESYIWYPYPSTEFDLFKELKNKGHKGERILLYNGVNNFGKLGNYATNYIDTSKDYFMIQLWNLIPTLTI